MLHFITNTHGCFATAVHAVRHQQMCPNKHSHECVTQSLLLLASNEAICSTQWDISDCVIRASVITALSAAQNTTVHLTR
jgi:hypothetical protein